MVAVVVINVGILIFCQISDAGAALSEQDIGAHHK